MSELFIIILIGAAMLYWQAAVRCKELSTLAARRECERSGVQLLDQTVQQLKLSLSRDLQGRWRVWREYGFEYSEDGNDRFKGNVVLLGQRVVRVALETFHPIIH